MGYSFSIKNINSVGHLVEGNVATFLKQCSSSPEILDPNIIFLDNLINRTEEDFYTSEFFWRSMFHDVERLRAEWREIKPRLEDLVRYKGELLHINRYGQILSFLKRLSNILSRCKVKSILLPGFGDSHLNETMLDKKLLRHLVRIHPGDTALILQLKERIYSNEIELFNVFKKFDVALNKVEQWPGVLLWNDKDSLFIPIKKESDISDIFEVLRYENDSFDFLRDEFTKKEDPKKYSYLFHLSDLHFGNKIAEKRKMRIVKILENQLGQLEESTMSIPIITGDLMDTPNMANKQAYSEFVELIISKGFENPIHILGNHDVDTGGFIKRLTSEKAVIQALLTPKKIEIINELNLGIIKFDSNYGGEFAQGKIGEDQFADMGNEFESIKNRDKINFIAILHHHPLEVKNPDWYKNTWYETLLGGKGHEQTMKLVDADIFLQWIESRNIKVVLHGHKHIPKIQKHNDVTIIGAGSSSGSIKHRESGKTYLSYNLIKYDNELNKPVSCTIIAEEILGAGTKNVLIQKL